MKRQQQGMTLIGFMITLAVAGFFAYCGMKLVPMYSGYYSVKQAMKGLANEPNVGAMSPEQMKDLFFRRLYISYAENVKPNNVKFERRDTGWLMIVDYELRKPLIYNLDVVGRFHAEQNMVSGGASD